MRTILAVHSIAGMVMAAAGFFIVEQNVAADDRGGYESEQGTHIFGTLDEALEGIQVPYAPNWGTQPPEYNSLSITAGQLHKLKDGTDLAGDGIVGTELITAQPAKKLITAQPAKKLSIKAARQHVNIYTNEKSASVWEYEVEVVVYDGEHRTSSPLCGYTQNTALVVPGNWNETGALLQQDTWFTFSCVPILSPNATSSLSVARNPTFISTVQIAPALGSRVHVATATPRAQGVTLSSFLIPKVTHFTPAQRLLWGLPLNEVEQPPRSGGGAAAKCIDYGYAPWVGGVQALGRTARTGAKLPAPSDSAARRFHNLCTRVMTADYAGDGRSHTIPGTVIRIADLTNLPVEECKGTKPCRLLPPHENLQTAAHAPKFASLPNPRLTEALSTFNIAQTAAHQFADLQYEGAWVDKAGIARAFCLTRARWQTIDATDQRLSPVHQFLPIVREPEPAALLGDHAAQRRRAPGGGVVAARGHADPEEPNTSNTWTYCEEGTLPAFDKYDVVLISYSAINERGLYRFRQNPEAPNTPARWITTSRVQATNHGIEIDKGIPCPAPCKLEAFEGDVLSPSSSPDTREGFSTIPIYLYRNHNGDYLTATKPASGFVATDAGKHPTPEGYLFKKEPTLPHPEDGHTGAYAPSLRLSERYLAKGLYCTTIRECDGAYNKGDELGFLLVPDSYKLHIPITPRTTPRPVAPLDPVERNAVDPLVEQRKFDATRQLLPPAAKLQHAPR